MTGGRGVQAALATYQARGSRAAAVDGGRRVKVRVHHDEVSKSNDFASDVHESVQGLSATAFPLTINRHNLSVRLTVLAFLLVLASQRVGWWLQPQQCGVPRVLRVAEVKARLWDVTAVAWVGPSGQCLDLPQCESKRGERERCIECD